MNLLLLVGLSCLIGTALHVSGAPAVVISIADLKLALVKDGAPITGSLFIELGFASN